MATYETLRGQVGHQIIEVVEIELDFCGLTYGIAPCTAAIGVTGSVKCFNTRKSCQDPANYLPNTTFGSLATEDDDLLLTEGGDEILTDDVQTPTTGKIYRFSSQKQEALKPPAGSLTPEDFVANPTLRSVTITPTEIQYQGMGKRATISVTLQDETSTDVGIDPYVSGRTYTPVDQGTYWGKLLARNPFYENRPLRYKIGFKDDEDNDWKFETREYIIDKISGPDANGKVTITGKDVLKLADDKRSQAPVSNTGELLADINDSVLAATLTPAGVGNLEYPTSGTMRIGNECMTYTRSGDALTFIARGTDGTTADDHSAGDPAQDCLRITNQRVDDILNLLLGTFANVDTRFLDTTQWAAEVDEWLVANLYTTLITQPTGVNELLTELITQGLFYVWYDEVEKKILMKAIAPQRDAVTTLTDDNNIIIDTMKVTEDEKRRLSQVWVVYDIIDPTGDIDKTTNFKKLNVTIDQDAESSDEYGDKRVKRIFSRWMTADDAGIATMLGARTLSKFRETPKTITFKLDVADTENLWTGADANLITKSLQDFEGASSSRPVEVLSVKQEKGGAMYTYMCEETQFEGRYAYIAPNTVTDPYSSASEADKEAYGFICFNTGLFLDGTEAYKII